MDRKYSIPVVRLDKINELKSLLSMDPIYNRNNIDGRPS